MEQRAPWTWIIAAAAFAIIGLLSFGVEKNKVDDLSAKLELNMRNKSQSKQLQDEIESLRGNIQARDERIYDLEAENRQLKNEVKKLQNKVDWLIKN